MILDGGSNEIGCGAFFGCDVGPVAVLGVVTYLSAGVRAGGWGELSQLNQSKGDEAKRWIWKG